MAQLKLTINGISGVRTIDDAKATALANIIYDNLVLPNWPQKTPLPSTPQERLQAVVDRLAIDIRDIARECRIRSLRVEQDASTRKELSAIDV